MKKSLILITFFILIPIVNSFPYCSDEDDNCANEVLIPCMSYKGWCCGTNFYYGTDCINTKIYFEESSEGFCIYEKYLGINGNLTFLNITTIAKYDGIEYDNLEISCMLNQDSFCENLSNTGSVNCIIFSPSLNILGSNFLECNISHPTLFLIRNSTSTTFNTFDFYVNLYSTEIQVGTSILPIYFKSTTIIPTDFILKLNTKNKNVKIYEETKKTNILNCNEEEKISYLIETAFSGTINFNLLVKPNLKITCSKDLDCSVFKNGKCINEECWASYDFSVYAKSKIQEFDYTYVYTFFLSILAFIFLILIIEVIVGR